MREAFKVTFRSFKTDVDFQRHEPARLTDVKACERGKHSGPDDTDVHLDLTSGFSSRWNRLAAKAIYDKMLLYTTGDVYPQRSDKFWKDLILEKIGRIKDKYSLTQPRYLGQGIEETTEEALRRAADTKVAADKRAKHNTRRRTARCHHLLLPSRLLISTVVV